MVSLITKAVIVFTKALTTVFLLVFVINLIMSTFIFTTYQCLSVFFAGRHRLN